MNNQGMKTHTDFFQMMLDGTTYYDAKVLDLQVLVCGDEVVLYYEDEGEFCWKVEFLFCHQLQYEYAEGTDWRKLPDVKAMKREQLDRRVQGIRVQDSELEGFYDIEIDLDGLEVFVRCKDLSVKRVKEQDVDFFWRKNQ